MNKIAARVGKSALAGQAAAYEPQDPYYETYTDAKGKERRRKRHVPEGLTARDAAILKKVRKRAHRLDKGFHICGFRFGWTFFIGLIPVAGDVADFVLGYKLVIQQAEKAEIPALLKSRMVTNCAIGAGLGFIPLVGDIALAAYRPNSRNAHLLEKFLTERAAMNPAVGSAQEQQAAASIIDRFKSFGFSKKTGEPQIPVSAGAAPASMAATSASGSRTPATATGNTISTGGNETARKQLVAHGQDGNVQCAVCSKIFENDTYGIQHVTNKHPHLAAPV